MPNNILTLVNPSLSLRHDISRTKYFLTLARYQERRKLCRERTYLSREYALKPEIIIMRVPARRRSKVQASGAKANFYAR